MRAGLERGQFSTVRSHQIQADSGVRFLPARRDTGFNQPALARRDRGEWKWVGHRLAARVQRSHLLGHRRLFVCNQLCEATAGANCADVVAQHDRLLFPKILVHVGIDRL